MSRIGSALSEIELKYPFAPRSRRFFESISMEEWLTDQVVKQAEDRLLNSLGRKAYEAQAEELVEFSSFFAAAFVASQDGYLVSRFARMEAAKARAFFVKERSGEKVSVMRECFGAAPGQPDGEGSAARYAMVFGDYLALVSRYELSRQVRWKLARQALWNGAVLVGDNLLNDLFSDCAQKAVAEGAKNLRKATFPKQLVGTRDSVLKYVPAQRTGTGKRYVYVDYLLQHPTTDGRHRLVWLVLAPYLVNVRQLADEEAIEKIRGFVAVGGETADMRRFIEYNVRRARRNGLLPPTMSTLRNEHPDLYALLPKDVQASETASKQRRQ